MNTWTNCREEIIKSGALHYPRSCAICGIGKCKKGTQIMLIDELKELTNKSRKSAKDAAIEFANSHAVITLLKQRASEGYNNATLSPELERYSNYPYEDFLNYIVQEFFRQGFNAKKSTNWIVLEW